MFTIEFYDYGLGEWSRCYGTAEHDTLEEAKEAIASHWLLYDMPKVRILNQEEIVWETGND